MIFSAKDNYEYIKEQLNIDDDDTLVANDVVFDLEDVPCVIIPYGVGGEYCGFCCTYGSWSLNPDIYMTVECATFDEVKNVKIWNGKSLMEILGVIEW